MIEHNCGYLVRVCRVSCSPLANAIHHDLFLFLVFNTRDECDVQEETCTNTCIHGYAVIKYYAFLLYVGGYVHHVLDRPA